jgi:organic radical activating enzyme
MIKTRCFPKNNYKSIYFNGKTMRIALDPEKPIIDLEYPEFYDIKITNKCNGKCNYCYQDSSQFYGDVDVLPKLKAFFESMDENQKPFQIAYGGGEPTQHYQFHEIMKMTREFGIAPNYTTNGMFTDYLSSINAIIETTKKYCEGVAVTCHPHLSYYWEDAANVFLENGIFTNFHNLISDDGSVNRFFNIYQQWKGRIKYFVVLPMMNQGRAFNQPLNHGYFFERLEELIDSGTDITDIAFGANFYPYLQAKKHLGLSLYEPEIMSKYLDLTDDKFYKSSFDTSKSIGTLGRWPA